MINRREESKSARSVLLEDFNEIDIYIEDTAVESKKIYTQLLNRVLDGLYSIEDVIPIGSSSKVIAEWVKHKKNKDNRPKIFIIDGDFIHLNKNLDKLIPNEFNGDYTGLYVLPRYCIENYLIDESAIIEVIHDEEAVDERMAIKKKIDFNEWIIANQDLLINLFIIYSICIENNVPEKTIKFKVSDLVDASNGCVSRNLVLKRIEHLKSKILSSKGTLNIEEEVGKRDAIINRAEKVLLKYVTGKDYLFPLIKQRINLHYNIQHISKISLKIRLAKQCDLSELVDLHKNIM